MNPTIAAAAWVLLTGGPPPVVIPTPTVPAPPILDCPAPPGNHITVRWVGDRHHHRRHHPHHHRGWRFDDQP